MENLDRLNWQKSSFSNNGAECVEVAYDGDDTLVRDSKDRSLTPHRYNSGEWAAFIAGAKAGEFDRG